MATRTFVKDEFKDKRTHFLLNAAITNVDTVADLKIDDFSSPPIFVIRCWGDFGGATLTFTEVATGIPLKDIADNAVAPTDIGVFSLQHVPLHGISIAVEDATASTSINVRIDQYV